MVDRGDVLSVSRIVPRQPSCLPTRSTASGGAGQRDLAVDLEGRQHTRNAECRMDWQDLVSRQLPLAQSRLHCLFDFALRRHSEAFEEPPELEIEDVLLHGYLLDRDPMRFN